MLTSEVERDDPRDGGVAAGDAHPRTVICISDGIPRTESAIRITNASLELQQPIIVIEACLPLNSSRKRQTNRKHNHKYLHHSSISHFNPCTGVA